MVVASIGDSKAPQALVGPRFLCKNRAVCEEVCQMTIRVVAEIPARALSARLLASMLLTAALTLAATVSGCSSSADTQPARDPNEIVSTGGNVAGTGGQLSGGSSSGGQSNTGGMILGRTGGAIDSGGSTSGGVSDTGGKDCTVERCNGESLDVDDCGFQTVEGEVETVEYPGNVLVVFDRSGSMNQDWGGVPRYEAAGNALISAVQPLQDVLTVGTVFFPSLDSEGAGCPCVLWDPVHWDMDNPATACCANATSASCSVNDISQNDQISFRPAADFISALPGLWKLPAQGSTPLETGLAQANAAIQATTFENSLSIIIVTDGKPTCNSNDQATVQQVADWAAAGYSTYVVGLPGAQEAADLLNLLAVTGGTGQYIDPGDPANLETQLRSILLETVKTGIESCSISLTPPAEVPEKLRLVVTTNGDDQAVDRMLSDDASWDVSADGAVVTLAGRLCDEAKSGAYDSLRFDFGCEELPPLPPPPGPDLE